MKIDFRAKKTEQGWADAWGDVLIPLGGTIINILGACLLVATFKFLHLRSGDQVFKYAAFIGEIGVYIMLYGFFVLKLTFQIFDPKQLSHQQRLLETGISIALCLPFFWLTNWFIAKLVESIVRAYPLL